MSCHDENSKITGVAMQNVSRNQEQAVVSFQAKLECKEDELEEIYKTLIGKILDRRNVIIISKGDQLIDLISDAVGPIDRNYVNENVLEMTPFTPQPESSVKHYAALIKNIPLSVTKDLASSTEFTFGNLFFLIPPSDVDFNQFMEDVISDVRKLTPSTFDQLPILRHEVVAAPAMYDGLKILWFQPNEDVYQGMIRPLFEN